MIAAEKYVTQPECTIYDYLVHLYGKDEVYRMVREDDASWYTEEIRKGYQEFKRIQEEKMRPEYEERKRLFKPYNPHPKGKIRPDCVKRACCKAMDMDYMAVQRMLNRIKREIGASHFTNPAVGWELTRRQGWEKIEFEKGEMTGRKFCKTHTTGTYILEMPRHWCCAKDGAIYDCTLSLDWEVKYAWKVSE